MKIEWCTFLGKKGKRGVISLKPLGVAKNGVKKPMLFGISTVPLVARRGNVLKVKGLDILDGTPILDVKPYWPVYDKVEKAAIPPWVNKLVF